MSSRLSRALPARLRSSRWPMSRPPLARISRDTRTRRKTRRIFSWGNGRLDSRSAQPNWRKK